MTRESWQDTEEVRKWSAEGLALLRWLDFEHAHPDIRSLVRVAHDTGVYWAGSLAPSPELLTALTRLVEALDWVKRAALRDAEPRVEPAE